MSFVTCIVLLICMALANGCTPGKWDKPPTQNQKRAPANGL